MIDDLIRDTFAAADTSAPPALLDDLGRRLALEFDAIAEPIPLATTARTRRRRALVAAGIATAVAAALVGTVIIERDRTPRANVDVQAGPSTTNAPKSSARALALAYAQHLLDEAALPPGTRTSPPPRVTAVPPFGAPKSQVDLRQQYAAPKSMRAAATYLDRHPTPSTLVLGQGSTTARGVTTLEVDHQVVVPPGDVINSARIVYTIAATGPNTSNIQVDVFVIWGPRHPHVPKIDKVVTVKGVIPGQPPNSRTVVVTDPAGVAELVTAFEQSKTIPVGAVYHCPAELSGAETYTVSFAGMRTAPPDSPTNVVVTVTDTGCAIAATKIYGRSGPELMGGNIVEAARAALRR